MAEKMARWWSVDTLAVVTGASKGLGLEMVKCLLAKDISVIFTSRDETDGKTALAKLRSQGFKNAWFIQLEIVDPSSVAEFIECIKQQFGGIDILINNTGHFLKHPFDLERANRVINVNYFATKGLIKQMIPLMKESSHGARIINMSTIGARLDVLRNEWRSKLADIDNMEEELIDEFVKAYLEDVSKGEHTDKGWPDDFGFTDFCVAKMALNAYTRMLGRDVIYREEGRKIFINCTSPGHTSSAMSGYTGHSHEIGADTAIWLALKSPSESTNGSYFVNKQDVGFDEIPLHHHDNLIYSVPDIINHLHHHSNYSGNKD